MEEVEWWTLQYDSLWLFSDGSVKEDHNRATYAWTVYGLNGENKRELCWGGGEAVGVARHFINPCRVVWTVGWTMVGHV